MISCKYGSLHVSASRNSFHGLSYYFNWSKSSPNKAWLWKSLRVPEAYRTHVLYSFSGHSKPMNLPWI